MEKATGWEAVETSSLGPAGVFSVSWTSCLCFPLFSLSLIFTWSRLLYSKFSNTWNYFWDGTTESFLDLITLQHIKSNGFWFVGHSLLLCNLSSPLRFAYFISSSIFCT